MIIGLGYKARSGKDTVAQYLHDNYGFYHVAFADSLKNAAREIFGLSEAQLYGDLKEVVDPFWKDTPRNILQKLGTECMRNGYRPDVWIKSLERKVLEWKRLDPEVNVVVSDVRFRNEAAAIHDWGGSVVCVERPNAPKIATTKHQSEVEMERYDSWNWCLVNEGTIETLHGKVDDMLVHLKVRYAPVHCKV